MKKITPKELAAKLETDTIPVLDVRAKEKFSKNPLNHKNAENFNVPKTEIFDAAENDIQADFPLTKQQEIIITCTTGNSASKCASILEEKGYQVTLLEGGITAWEAFKHDEKKS